MRLGVQITLVLLASACAIPSRYRAYESGQIAPGETLIVGRIELVPPLGPNEQDLKGINAQLRGIVMLITSERKEAPESVGLSEARRRMDIRLGETFYMRGPSKPFFVTKAMIYMRVTSREPEGARAHLPAGFRVDIQPGDRAVYIGTLRYHRDEFFRITRVDFVDEFEGEALRFAKRFGAYPELRRALLIPVKRP